MIIGRKSEENLSTTEVTQKNLGLPLLPNSPDLHQNNEMKSCADPASSFTWVTPGAETIKSWNNRGDISLPSNCASVLQTTPRVTSTSSRIKTTTIGLIIYKHSARTTLHHLARGMTEGKLPHPWGNTRKFWTHLPPSLPWFNTRNKMTP